jgi:hypothetical protein
MINKDDKKKSADAELSDKTGALLMLNKEERKLIKELLIMTMNSESVKSYIVKKLGKNYLEVGASLLKTMGAP